MNRRVFLAAAAVIRPYVILHAVAGPQLPQHRVVWGVARAGFYEWRVYRGAQVGLAGIFERNGIHIAQARGMSFLLAFQSLEQRNSAWTRVAADPQWIAMRDRAQVSEITIYRA